MGFINTPACMALLEGTARLADLDLDDYDALMIAGGQSPMFSFRDNEEVKGAIAHFYEAEKPTGRVLPRTARSSTSGSSDGSYLVEGQDGHRLRQRGGGLRRRVRRQQIMPWRIEDALRERGANYIQGGLFKAFAVRDGRLITGQQQYSGRKVAQMVIETLGV